MAKMVTAESHPGMNKSTLFGKATQFVASWRWRAIARWLVVAVGFSAVSIGMLYVLVDWVGVSLLLATFLSAEIATILRFFVNNRWVFDDRTGTWKGLWQFHCANAGGFVVWWSITNLLPHYGINYLIAATAGIGGSVGISMLTNFLWIWRSRGRPEAAAVAGQERGG